MDPEIIKTWLIRRKKRGSLQHAALAVVALLAGLVILFLTFWFTYAVVYASMMGFSALSELAFNKKLSLGHTGRLIASGVFVVLLFVQHFRTDPSHWGDYPDRDYVSAPALQYQAGVIGGLGFMLAYPGASANMVADILLSGPRLVVGAWGLVGQARVLKRMDENGCGELLAFLASKPTAVPYEELENAGWADWLAQLRCVEGVNFLKQGISLSSELRMELNELTAA